MRAFLFDLNSKDGASQLRLSLASMGRRAFPTCSAQVLRAPLALGSVLVLEWGLGLQGAQQVQWLLLALLCWLVQCLLARYRRPQGSVQRPQRRRRIEASWCNLVLVEDAK